MGVDLSETLPGLLAERGMTQKQLAEKTGIKRTDINALAKGRVKAGEQRLRRLAEGLDVSVAELGGQSENGDRRRGYLARLEALEAAVDELQTARDRERRALAGRLDRIEEALQIAVRAQTRPT